MELPYRRAIVGGNGLPGDGGSWRRAALVSLAVLVLAGAVVGLIRSGAGGRDDQAASGDSTAMAASPTTTVPSADRGASSAGMAADEASAVSGGTTAGDTAPPATGPGVDVGPRIVRTAELRIRVRGEFADALERAGAVATSAGGFVAQSSTSSFAKGR